MAYQTKTARKPKGRHHNSRRAAAIIISVLVIAGGVFAFLCIVKPFDKKTDNDANVSQKSDDAGKSSGSVDPLGEQSKKKEEHEKEKGIIPQNAGEDPNTLENITGIISHAGVDGGVLTVHIMLDQALGNAGTCNVTLTNAAGAAVSGSVQTEAGPSATFCVYSVSVSSLSSGHWQITAKVTADKKEGIISGEVNI